MRSRFYLSCALVALAPSAGWGQFYSYPSFQVPQIAVREFNFGVADGGKSGTLLLFQWREGLDSRTHLQADAGLADPEVRGGDARFVIGGAAIRRLNAASEEMPLDLVGTLGIGGSFGGGTSFLRLPVGVSVGHSFELEQDVTITPFAHPRLSLDLCSDCGRDGRRDNNIGVDFDIGVSVGFGKHLALRASALFAGSDQFGRENAFGVSLAWTPAGLR